MADTRDKYPGQGGYDKRGVFVGYGFNAQGQREGKFQKHHFKGEPQLGRFPVPIEEFLQVDNVI